MLLFPLKIEAAHRLALPLFKFPMQDWALNDPLFFFLREKGVSLPGESSAYFMQTCVYAKRI